MKKCNFVLPVKFSTINIASVEKITFKFKQGAAEVLFSYPSDTAVYDSTNACINLIWGYADAFKFSADEPVFMDTLIKMTGSATNPETNVVKLHITDTLFTKEEVEENG